MIHTQLKHKEIEMADPKRPNPTDIIVGANVRKIRTQRGISQEALASRLGVTFQQVQKYEKGTNRISASRLQQIADALQCKLIDLFGGVEAGSTAPLHEFSKGALKAAALFDGIADDAKRDALLRLMGSLVDQRAAGTKLAAVA